MHWTAILEKRYFPAHARVLDDLACIECGYNLRHARAGGPCPECGRPVADSLWALARPDQVARGLRSIGWSYVALVLLPLLGPGAGLGVMALVLVAAAIVRLMGAAELRFRAAIVQLPCIGPRVRLLWALAIVDALLACGFAAVFAVDGTVGGMGRLAGMTLLAWVAATFATAGAAGWMGSALGSLLGHDSAARGLRIQWVLAIAAGAEALLIGLLSLLPSALAFLVLLGCAVVGWLGVTVLTVVALLSLAGAAEQERVPLDELVNAGPTYQGQSRPRERDLPDKDGRRLKRAAGRRSGLVGRIVALKPMRADGHT